MVSVKRIIFILFLLLLFNCGKATAFDEKCGIGIVEVVPYNFFSIEFWKGPSIEKPYIYDQIDFYTDSLKKLKYQFTSTGTDSIPAWFNPQTFIITKEYKKMVMICVKKEDNWCEVITNNKTGATKWVELGFDVTFEEWPIFLVTVRSIDIVKGDSLLFETPMASAVSSPINLNYDHSYKQEMHCKEVKGMWMKIEIVELNEFGGIINKRSGWIKWRDENEMLIDYIA